MPLLFRKIFTQYKGLHLLMWALVCFSTFITYYDSQLPIIPQFSNALMVIIISTLPFYITGYVLIPQFLYKKRFWAFSFRLIGLVIGSGIFMMLAVRTVDQFFDPTIDIIPKDSAKLRFALNIFIWTALIASFGAGGLKIMIDSFRLRKQLYMVEKEKIQAELNFLRSQVNPHFLFNVMNLIYFQIDKKNKDARESVEKLSEMLRYQLYECTTDMIEIGKELDYIKNYVAIQTLRLEKGTDILMKIDDGMQNFKIAPLLILPLVENAFKYISHHKNVLENMIHIHLTQEQEKFFNIRIINTYDTLLHNQDLLKTGGLGVQNLSRRLELLYPGKHHLEVHRSEQIFESFLSIQYAD
ncbi:MAG: histidine kinase [Bacteroidetes bacterium]|nr:histidine kinase [Bacteroidota bacterium]